MNMTEKYAEGFSILAAFSMLLLGSDTSGSAVRGAEAYKKDLKSVEVHLFDTGHFALEDHGDEIAALMLRFLDTQTTNAHR